MDVAALIVWIATALGGSVLLAKWVSHGGLRQQQAGTSGFPAPVIFGHFLLAGAGLVLWIIYLVSDTSALAWVSFAALVAVALLGFTMFARWLPLYRSAPTSVMSGRGPGADTGTAPAERHLPPLIVAGHGLLGATTLVLVLLAAAGVGS